MFHLNSYTDDRQTKALAAARKARLGAYDRTMFLHVAQLHGADTALEFDSRVHSVRTKYNFRYIF
jgi:hypothetical protein